MKFEFDYRASDSSLVDVIYHTQSVGGGSFMSSAGTQWEMVVTWQEGKTTLSLRGPETKASLAPIPENANFLGIIFKHGAFMPHLPMVELLDGGIHLPQAASSHSFYLHGSAWQFPTFENTDTFINRLVRQGLLVHDPVVAAALQEQDPAMSPRHLRRRFLRATGLTPGTIEQIQRAHRAAALLEKGLPILDTVFEAGYFDQPHLTRSLKRFIGQTPAQLLRELEPASASK
jgi:AraC-like DNA-binding protein